MSGDPIHYLLEKFNDIKADTADAVSATMSQISDSDTVRALADNEHVRTLGSSVRSAFDSVSTTITNIDYSHPIRSVVGSGSNSFPQPPATLTSRITAWVNENKILTAVLVSTITGGSLFYLYKASRGEAPGPRVLRSRHKRVARKAENGGRIEIVVLVGSPAEPLTRTIATDLDRRGYIIYWTAASREEEELVLRERSEDIIPLRIGANDMSSVRSSIATLGAVLSVPTKAFPGATPHHLTLAGVVLVPDLYYHGGPVESIPFDTWKDLLNSKILGPVCLLSNGLMDLVRTYNSRVLLVTPTILGSLNPGFHGAESMITAALNALALSMSRELAPLRIPFVHIKMGSFDVNTGRVQHERQVQTTVHSNILSWSENLQHLYSDNYKSMSALLIRGKSAGSSLRNLNYTIFDALTARHPKRVYYTGRGAWTYTMIPAIMPEWVVGWLMSPSQSENKQAQSWGEELLL